MDQKVKELEILGCRTFVCPNLSIISEKGKELNLKEETIERAKNLAVEYFKKTYHIPHYSSVKSLLPAFIYVACVLEGEKINQIDIIKVFGTSQSTIRKWYIDITDTLGIDIKRDMKLDLLERDKYALYLDEICEMGKSLELKDETIEEAKDLALKYFKVTYLHHYYHYIKQLIPAFVYTASIVGNDRRSQLEVFKVSGVTQVIIGKWYNDIMRILGMKIIENCGRVSSIIYGKYDD